MEKSSDENEKQLQELKAKKTQLEIEYNKIVVKFEIDDEAAVKRIIDIVNELDNIENEIMLLKNSKSFDGDDAR